MPAESTAVVLTERIDALAAALREAGVSPERSADLLAAAAAATMHAVALDALLDNTPQPRAAVERPVVVAPRRAAPVSLAA
jgi:hypothetical protein